MPFFSGLLNTTGIWICGHKCPSCPTELPLSWLSDMLFILLQTGFERSNNARNDSLEGGGLKPTLT